jgi:hypothetical protein
MVDLSVVELDADTLEFCRKLGTFFGDPVTDALYERTWRLGLAFDEQLHRQLGARRWLTPDWPTNEGSIGATPTEVAILAPEAEAHWAPTVGHVTPMLGEPAVRTFGAPAPNGRCCPVLPGATWLSRWIIWNLKRDPTSRAFSPEQC